MRFPSVIASIALLCLASCSSANFNVASSGDGGTDTGGVDPCAPVDGIAKFCVTVTVAPGHPGYDGTSTGTLPLDGNGTLQLILFAADPIANPGTTPLPPIQYNGGASLNIDGDFPVTFSSSAPPGTYWFIAVFEDDATSPRDNTKVDPTLPGDFTSVPTIDSSFQIQLPQLMLTNGKTASLPALTLHAVRRVIADLHPTAELRGIQAANAAIHGDGPTGFLIFDGQLDSTSPPPTIYDAKQGDCVRLFNPDPVTGYPIKVPFNTTIDGTHNLLAFVQDYPVPKGTFPGKGTLYSPFKDIPSAKVAQMNPGSQWSSEPEIAIAIVDPYTTADAPTDTLTCK
jgi:hypothetical protein